MSNKIKLHTKLKNEKHFFEAHRAELKRQIDGLNKVKGDIPQERFDELYSERLKKLDELENTLQQTSMLFNDSEQAIKDLLESQANRRIEIKEEIDKTESEIRIENEVFKNGGCTKSECEKAVAPLTDRKRKLERVYNRLTKEINKLSAVINSAPSEKSLRDTKAMTGNKLNGISISNGESSFGGDFAKGVGVIFLIIFVLFIGLPLVYFALKAGYIIAIPILVIVLIVIVIALLGKLINFIGKKW